MFGVRASNKCKSCLEAYSECGRSNRAISMGYRYSYSYIYPTRSSTPVGGGGWLFSWSHASCL